jgi:hypothetical protein
LAVRPPSGGLGPGTPVLVLWSDGHRYPAQVQETTGEHSLVVFNNGHQQWIPNDSLTPA